MDENLLGERLAALATRLPERLDEIEALATLVRTGDDADVVRINPIRHAAEHDLAEAAVVEVFLHGKVGLLRMEWQYVCAGCGDVIESFQSLTSATALFLLPDLQREPRRRPERLRRDRVQRREGRAGLLVSRSVVAEAGRLLLLVPLHRKRIHVRRNAHPSASPRSGSRCRLPGAAGGRNVRVRRGARPAFTNGPALTVSDEPSTGAAHRLRVHGPRAESFDGEIAAGPSGSSSRTRPITAMR